MDSQYTMGQGRPDDNDRFCFELHAGLSVCGRIDKQLCNHLPGHFAKRGWRNGPDHRWSSVLYHQPNLYSTSSSIAALDSLQCILPRGVLHFLQSAGSRFVLFTPAHSHLS